MLYEAHGITRFVVVCGYVDLRKGVQGLAQILEGNFALNPFEQKTMFLFCGKRGERFKALVWEGNGFLMLYKKLENGTLHWPRTPQSYSSMTFACFNIITGLVPSPRIPTEISND